MKRRVFFLGAGFSKLAGFPLMSDFYNFIDEHSNNTNGGLKATFDSIGFKECKKILDDLGLNSAPFSDGFSVIHTIARNCNSTEESDQCKRQKARIPLYFYQSLDIVVKAFISKQEKIKESIKNGCKLTKYREFFSKLQKGDTIISLNYDLLPELFLWNKEKWTFLNGYGIDLSDKALRIDYPNNKPKKSNVKIYKIHGSLNWILQNDTITLRDTAFLFDVEGANLPQPATQDTQQLINCINFPKTIIFPLYNENFIAKSFLLNIWEHAFSKMSQASEIFFIGSNFDDFDSHLFLPIRQAASVEKTIYNINPDSGSSDRLEKIISKSVKSIKRTFEKWNMFEMENCRYGNIRK